MKSFKIQLLGLIVLSVICSSCKQGFQSEYIDESLIKWDNGTAYTEEFLDLISDDQLGFKPTEEEMSIIEQVIHMGSNMQRLGGMISTKPSEVTAIDTSASLEELRGFFIESSAYARECILANMDRNLGESVPFQKTTLTKRQIIELMHDHHTHHRGQLVVYWRLLGLKPPQYRGW